jgi:hypothetical protein
MLVFREHHKVNDSSISAAVKQIEGFGTGTDNIYYSGLAVSAWDINQYLKNNPRQDANGFKEIVSAVEAEDRKFERIKYFPYSDPQFPRDELEALPKGMAADAADGNPLDELLKKLGDRKIVQSNFSSSPRSPSILPH